MLTEPGISVLMHAAEGGDGSAAQTLFASLYSELHQLAARELARRGFAVTLRATTLLHKAYLERQRSGDGTTRMQL